MTTIYILDFSSISIESSRRVIRNFNKTLGLRNIATLLVAIPLVSPFGFAVASVLPSTPAAEVVLERPVVATLNDKIVEAAPKEVSIPVTTPPPAHKPKGVAVKPVVATPKVTVNVLPDPGFAEKRAWVQKAAAAHGIDWKILEAVWQVESGKRWHSSIQSYAGAGGPCQFMPGTWRGYASDGNGDGVKDKNYAPDCLFGAAKLLAVNGAASGDNVRALLRYNHSMAYVNKVISIANSISD